jgi:hypothetical protein
MYPLPGILNRLAQLENTNVIREHGREGGMYPLPGILNRLAQLENTNVVRECC